jgi:hypothetical protein
MMGFPEESVVHRIRLKQYGHFAVILSIPFTFHAFALLCQTQALISLCALLSRFSCLAVMRFSMSFVALVIMLVFM